mgnify:CR=1 FL=1
MDLRSQIKLLRTRANLTQRALAEKSGISYSYVTKLEAEEGLNPTYETLKALSEVLDAPLVCSAAPTVQEAENQRKLDVVISLAYEAARLVAEVKASGVKTQNVTNTNKEVN